MTALVLSGSYTETNRFAQQKKLGYGIRHVVSAANLEGRRPTSIHILPSYYQRRDIHAVKAAMKHVFRLNRHCPVTDWDLDPHTGVYHKQGQAAVFAAITASEAPSDASPVPSRLEALEALAADIDDVDTPKLEQAPVGTEDSTPQGSTELVDEGAAPAPDTSKDAVPGQTAIEEHIESHEAAVDAVEEALEDDDVPDWMK